MIGPSRTAARLVLATLTVIGGTASAAPAAWTSGGPYGGPVVPLVVDPSNPAKLYAGTDSGVFRSTDFGTTWARTSLSNQNIHSLVIDGAAAPTIYALSKLTGLYRSTDSGSTWFAVLPPPPVPGFYSYKGTYALAADPTTPATLYAAYYGDGFSSPFVRACKSTNSGGTWQPLSPSVDPSYGLAVDPAAPSTVFAIGSSRLSRSTDGGNSWADPAMPVNFIPRALALDAQTPGTLYVGSRAGQGSNRLIKSTDSGGSFIPAGTGLPNADIHALVVDPATPSTLYASTASGVFESTDSGATWSATSVTSPTNAVAIDLLTATLYAATSYDSADIRRSILKSTDAGDTWAAATVGLTGADILSLAVHVTPPAAIYAGTKGQGLFKSTDSGSSWVLTLSPSVSFGDVGAIAIDPSDPATVYSGADGVRKSTDSGVTWSAPTGGIQVRALAIDPVTPTTLYAGGDYAMEKSTDGGVTWSPSAGFSTNALAIDPSTPATVYAGTAGGVMKSINAGFTWSSSSVGANAAISALVMDPATPATLYAAGAGGVFKSTNAGATWTPANFGISIDVVHALAIDPNATSTLYAAGTTLGAGTAFKSTNGGASWAAVKRGLPKTPSIDSLALDPTGRTTLYAGVRMGSVWQASPFAKGDMDGDGLPDLVFRSTLDGTHNKVWRMDGVTRASEAVITPDAQGADWKIRAVDDFDSDGLNDLAVWNQSTGSVEFWLMNGMARSSAPVPLSGAPVLDTSWDLSATADFNHDSLPDIVWRNFTSQKIVVWTMNGTAKIGSIVPTPDQALNGNWIIVAALDYNNDANIDFLWYNVSSGKLVTWYMNASVVRTTGQFTTPDAAGNNNWKVLASADYSRAYVPGTPPLGSPDIVWRNETSGNQVVWHMDFASARVHGQFTNPAANAPALDWTIVGPR